MEAHDNGRPKPAALSLLASHRPRNVGWLQAAGLLFGDWGTSRLYVLGLAFFFAGQASFYLICAMSLLMLAVGWAYMQICRIYPDGGGVYTAAKHRSQTLAVIGALMLCADYIVTASLSSLDAFRYFDLPQSATLFAWDSPGLWAIIAVAAIGLFNFMGPKHTGRFAIFAALGMVLITLMITVGAVPRIHYGRVVHLINNVHEPPTELWVQYVSIMLALSGVEAIANLTGVMKRPVSHTARKSIWIVACEVAFFNIVLALAMVWLSHSGGPLQDRAIHKDDMLAYLSFAYIGRWAELIVRAIAGILLLSATNTAITALTSIVYVVSRDGEMPTIFQKVNRFGAPWMAAALATSLPILILIISHDMESLAALYAIGVIGAISINVTLCAMHPRLRRMRRKVPMLLLGIFMVAIWITLAFTKLHALVFVVCVMAVGLSTRALNKWWRNRHGPRKTLLQQAVVEQLPADVPSMPKALVGTYGSETLAPAALAEAKREHLALVVCFIREIQLSIKWEERLTLETDLAAQKVFARYLELGHEAGVPVVPVYDQGPDAATLMAETAATYGVEKIFIGTTRRGALHQLIKGHFQRHLEELLPPEIQVKVISTAAAEETPAQVEDSAHTTGS